MPRKCFIVMPIGSRQDGSFQKYHEIYRHLIQPAVEAVGMDFVCLRADEIRKTGSIIREIIDEISEADVVIADLTGSNPNVFYELGVRHALAGRSIMITQKLDLVPFDLRPYRVIEYDPSLSGAANFREELVQYLSDVVNRPSLPDNPVQDFLKARSEEHQLRAKLEGLQEENRRLTRELSHFCGLWPIPSNLPQETLIDIVPEIAASRRRLGEKLIVVDDDPGGMHALSKIPFYLGLDEMSIQEAIDSEESVVFLVTDTRSHKPDDAVDINFRLGRLLAEKARLSARRLTIISRGDSTLRGHYPAEADALRRAFEDHGGVRHSCEIFCPAYIEAGRVTIARIHWLREGEHLRPIALTDYARDPTFGFLESHLGEWMQARLRNSTNNLFDFITLDEIRGGGAWRVARKLSSSSRFTRYICEAFTDQDVEIIAHAACIAEEEGVRVFARGGPSFVRARAGLARHNPSIDTRGLQARKVSRPGLVVIGSITELTRRQREIAEKLPRVSRVELNADKLYNPFVRTEEIGRVRHAVASGLKQGSDVILQTSDYYEETGEQPLDSKGRVLFALAEVVRDVIDEVGFVIAKGSDTAYLIMKESLGMRRSVFEGTVMTGIGLCFADGSQEGRLPVFVVQGNTGQVDSLMSLMEALRRIEVV